ncbi:MAG: hypothetical protein M0Q91_10015 [Methanoregula sp.]|jgi:hypothetical protein|nr:hypothetical protein [Methanoregula sp.]
MPTKKLDNDPTQSLWLENKYAKELVAAMTGYTAGLIDIIKENPDDPERIRQLQDEYKAEAIETKFKPLATKYITMAAKQGGKFAKLQLKRYGKKT